MAPDDTAGEGESTLYLGSVRSIAWGKHESKEFFRTNAALSDDLRRRVACRRADAFRGGVSNKSHTGQVRSRHGEWCELLL